MNLKVRLIGVLFLLGWLLFGCAAWRHPKYPLTPVGGVTCKTGLLKPFGGPGWHDCVDEQDTKPQPIWNGSWSCPANYEVWTTALDDAGKTIPQRQATERELRDPKLKLVCEYTHERKP